MIRPLIDPSRAVRQTDLLGRHDQGTRADGVISKIARAMRWLGVVWALACLFELEGRRSLAQPFATLGSAVGGTADRPARATPGLSRYRPPTAAEGQFNRRQALDWADQTRRTIVPTMHLVETAHFLMFSAWNSSNDAALARVCEQMYESLRKQFNLAPSETVWIGKCPVYLFWETAHFRRFIEEVDQIAERDKSAARSDGYHATQGRFSYIVINGVRDFGASHEAATTRFYEVLVHEGTHAFMNRYLSNRPLPRWVEEGLADFMAAQVVPNCRATRKHVEGARLALREPQTAARLFDKTDLTSADYGLAQSAVRFLIQIDARAFIEFVAALKRGESDRLALAEALGFSREQMLRDWIRFCGRAAVRSSF